MLRAALVAVLSVLLLAPFSAPADAAKAPKPPTKYGVSYGERLSRMSPADLEATLDDAVMLGVKWIRMDISWTSVQPDGPTTWRWDNVDRVIRSARSRGRHRGPTPVQGR